MKITFPTAVSLVLLVVLLVGAYFYFSGSLIVVKSPLSTSTEQTTGTYACNSDGKLCPDGTVVGRTGPECTFAACPGVYPVSDPRATTTKTAMAVLYGRTVMSPVCPVEHTPPQPECEPKGFSTQVVALDARGMVINTQVTSSNGTFIMDLIPGRYTLHANTSGAYPKCEDVVVSMANGATSSAIIACDSGIR